MDFTLGLVMGSLGLIVLPACREDALLGDSGRACSVALDCKFPPLLTPGGVVEWTGVSEILQGTCAEGVCAVTCRSGGGCSSSELCTSPPGSQQLGICLRECQSNDDCEAGLSCVWGTFEGRVCAPSSLGMFDVCEPPAPDQRDACAIASVAMTCTEGVCLLPCEAPNETCPAGLGCADLISKAAGTGNCLLPCLDDLCPEGQVCQNDRRGDPYCVAESVSCERLDTPVSCGACGQPCGYDCVEGVCTGLRAGLSLASADFELGTGLRPRESAGAVLLPGERVLVVGGRDDSGPLTAVDVYVPGVGTIATRRVSEHDSWHGAGVLPGPRAGAAVGIVDGTVLVVGGVGADENPENSSFRASVAAFEGSSGDVTWSTGPSLASARAYAAHTVYGGRLWVLGGLGADGEPLASVESCDATSCRAEVALPEALAHASAQVSSAGLVVAGGVRANGTLTGQWYRYVEGAYVQVTLRTGSGEPMRASEAVLVADLDGRVLRAGGALGTAEGAAFAAPSGTYHPELDAVSYAYLGIDGDNPLNVRRAAGLTMADGRIVLVGGRDAKGLRANALVLGTVRTERVDEDTIAVTGWGTVYLDDPRMTEPLGIDDGTAPVFVKSKQGETHTVMSVRPGGLIRVEVPVP